MDATCPATNRRATPSAGGRFLRPNHVAGSTANPAIRHAMLAEIDQIEVMTAVMDGDPTNMFTDVGILLIPNKAVREAGMEKVRTRQTPAQVKAMLERAGYRGERLVMLYATDHTLYDPSAAIVTHQLRKVGFTIDGQAMDWGTVQTRRTSREPTDKGGWSMFPTVTPVPDYGDPLLADFIRSNGKDAWFDWPDDPKIERIYEPWLETSDEAEQTRLERDYQLQAAHTLPCIPLGGYRQTSAWRSNLSGILKGPSIVFWNVKKG
jgi:peptide/nickel transport system substrate-binding protein